MVNVTKRCCYNLLLKLELHNYSLATVGSVTANTFGYNFVRKPEGEEKDDKATVCANQFCL